MKPQYIYHAPLEKEHCTAQVKYLYPESRPKHNQKNNV